MRRSKSVKNWIIRDILSLAAFLVLFLTVLSVFTYLYYAQDIVDKETVMNRNDIGFILSDRDSKPFFYFSHHKYNKIVPLTEISPRMQKAVIAAEDQDFYTHPGFSVKGIARAVIKDVLQGRLVYGGSTITQQLIKNALLNPRKNFLRKYQELILASEIERRFTKTEILEMYLNSVYLGKGSFGVEEAAQAYFGKRARDLDLAESAFLTGLLPAPSRLSDLEANLEEAKLRQRFVLQNMVEQKYITEEEAKKASEAELQFKPPEDPLNNEAIHFALMVRDELVKRYGEENLARGSFQIKTTIDLNWQKYAEEAVRTQVQRLGGNNVTNGAAVVLDPRTGEVKALVGSVDWYNEKFGKVDIPTAVRQPGSSFKPIVYAAALEKGAITLGTTLHDQPTTFSGNYRPKNYDGKFRGNVTPRRALSNSLNVPSVEVMSKIGVADSLEMAQRLGINTLTSPDQYGLSLVLGAGEVKLLEMAIVYGTFANKGVKVEPTMILEVRDKKDQVIYQYQPDPKPVLSARVAFLISSILSDSRARSEVFGNALDISRPAAVKTGTTENYRDAWTLGYTPSLVVGAWVGNNDGAPMDNIAGSLGAAPIWKGLMEQFLSDTPTESFTPPEGVLTCSFRGPTYRESTPSAYTEFFVEGSQPSSCSTAGPSPAPSPTKTQSAPKDSQPTPAKTATPTPTPKPTTPSPTISPPKPTKSKESGFYLLKIGNRQIGLPDGFLFS